MRVAAVMVVAVVVMMAVTMIVFVVVNMILVCVLVLLVEGEHVLVRVVAMWQRHHSLELMRLGDRSIDTRQAPRGTNANVCVAPFGRMVRTETVSAGSSVVP